MEFCAENVEKALAEFYVNTGLQQQLNTWLTAAQVSREAWSFSWQLLALDKSPEVQFFGASCLQAKISKSWHELSPEQIRDLRGRLFDEIVKFVGGAKIVLTRLCVALCTLLLHSTPTVWPDAVKSIVDTVQQPALTPQLQEPQRWSLLLDIFTVLPEEFETATLGQYKRAMVRNELERSLPQVVQFLTAILTEAAMPLPVRDQALRCTASWALFGLPLAESDVLIGRVFAAFGDPLLFDSAIEVLVNLFDHPGNERYPGTIEKLLPQVIGLRDIFQRAIADSDADVCQSCVRLFSTVGAQTTKLLINLTLRSDSQRSLVSEFVNLLLSCSSVPGYYPVGECCSDLPFGFWYSLQDEILATETETFLALTQMFAPIYMSLASVLLRKLQYPTEDGEFESWSEEEKEAHRCYRQDIADTFMYIYNFLHDVLLGNLCALVASLTQTGQSEAVRWQDVEAVLFALAAVAENVDVEEAVYLPTVFAILPCLPCRDNVKVAAQSLHVIGAYAQWISSHPDVLSAVVPLLLQGLGSADLTLASTMALKEVTRELSRDSPQSLLLYAKPILAESKAALDQNTWKGKDTVRLVTCMGYVLSVLPPGDVLEYLNLILTPHLVQLQQLASAEPTLHTRQLVQLKINIFASLFSSLSSSAEGGGGEVGAQEDGAGDASTASQQSHIKPVLILLQQILPVLCGVLQKWIIDSSVVETICDMLKRALRTLMNDFTPLAKDVTSLVVEMYTAVPHSIILDLAKQVLILLSSDAETRELAQVVFVALCTKSLSVLDKDASQYPDVMEQFMSLLAQITKKCSHLLDSDQCNVEGLFLAGVHALSMHESVTVKAACLFLSEYMTLATRVPRLKVVIEGQGHKVTERLMKAIGGESPRALVDNMADVFFAMSRNHFDDLCRWLNAVVDLDGFPTANATRSQKEQFARLLLRERTNKRKVHEIVNEYTLLWRGMIGSEYAAQTTNISA